MSATEESLRLHFIGNATVLIQYGELTLLTDPNFLHRGQFAYLGYGLFTRRLTEPDIGIAELPALDAVLLSHLHGDHWDRVARRNLPRELRVLTTPHAAHRLRHLHGFQQATGLSAWESQRLARGGSQVLVTSTPARHSEGLLRLALPPVMGSMLEFGPKDGPARTKLYISGDTMLFDGLRDIAYRFPLMDVAILHLGGTRLPGGFTVTLDGLRGAKLVDMLRPQHVLPVHYSDYTAMKSPLSAFLAETEHRGLRSRVTAWCHGQHVVIAADSSKVILD